MTEELNKKIDSLTDLVLMIGKSLLSHYDEHCIDESIEKDKVALRNLILKVRKS